MILSLSHINLTVPPGTLPHALAFYGVTLGLIPIPVPQLQRDTLAWFDIGQSGQQVHISASGSVGAVEEKSSRHPCFKVGSVEELRVLQGRVWESFGRGGDGGPREADGPGEVNSGSQGVEYPTRFFARDYAGNRLEFSL